jgi:hypothetical protein
MAASRRHPPSLVCDPPGAIDAIRNFFGYLAGAKIRCDDYAASKSRIP